MMLSQNKVEINNAKILGSSTKTSYIETRMDYTQMMETQTQDGSINAYVSLYIMMDDEYRMTTLQV